MIDRRISELEQAQAVSPDDLLAIVQNVNGTLQTRKITVNQFLSSLGVSNTAARLVINDGNISQYFTDLDNMPIINNTTDLKNVFAYIPEGYSTIVVETTLRYKIVKIKPLQGLDFEDYKKITFMGNVEFCESWADSGNPPSGGLSDYRISQYWYAHRHGNYPILEAFTEFVLKNKVWYSVFY